MTSKEQHENFINTISTIVMNINNGREKHILPSVAIAQACLESGYGTSAIMMKANAVYGIKAGRTWTGKVYSAKTKECYDGVYYTTITDLFRAYDSLEESVADYYDLITSSYRYKDAVNERDYIKCITAIKEGGYATSPTYIKNICKVIEDNNLTRFDKMNDNYYGMKLIYTGHSNSIIDALNSDDLFIFKRVNGIDSSKDNRKKLAVLNGIKDYNFTAEDNTLLLSMLKNGGIKYEP